jgi:hypothetical protein
MRLPILLLFATAATVLASSPVPASDCTPARPASQRVSFRPRAWSPPPAGIAARPAPGMTEGDPAAEAGASGDLPGQSRAEAFRGVVVEVRSDGSRHAVLGGAIRAWSIAGVDEHGRIQLDCASSEAAARARVRAAGTRGGK